jgi:hypothetical protein
MSPSGGEVLVTNAVRRLASEIGRCPTTGVETARPLNRPGGLNGIRHAHRFAGVYPDLASAETDYDLVKELRSRRGSWAPTTVGSNDGRDGP